MQGRVWVVVGVFAGVAVMLGAWMLLANEPATQAAKERAGARGEKGPKIGKLDRKAEIPPDRLKQLSVQRLAQRPGTPGGPPAVAQVPAGPAAPPDDEAETVYPLDASGVKDAVASRMGDLKACYETALFHTPDLSGKMTLSLDVEPSPGQAWGLVERVDTDSDLDATVFEGCVATVFEELRFAATEPATLRYPLVFEASGDEGEAPEE